ncbi:TonB-dependent receptor [Empedobacter falsenii]|uniref:TonB-dependent receptor n=2 Tax=Empedobacter falsenii TaxID=343874 RepID=A0A427BQ77_9FLAO|nr:TonB-dependent receptor [Empedobacter falsenii]RRT91764.1 TonB-dependent receptor [Empedobacter falsenii]RRT92375.1 TonB-dependent receptor [Empedobacter falsenii]
MRLNSTKLLLVGAFALMASLSFAQVVEPTDSTKVEQGENVSLGETLIIGKGVIDIAEDRKTPIAATTITKEVIEQKVGANDITQAFVNTPSIYVAGQAGGFGDSRVITRGFDQSNTAFLLNGQPINGMEDGKVYWSNWSGMTDIANAVQIQRGLGSSKLAISSVGGTYNFVTKATEKKEGGFFSAGIANDDYYKTTLAYNTGLINNKFGVSVMMTHWQGNGYNDGTKGQGQNYFISLGYKPSEKHTLNLLFTGAPQWHDQNYSKSLSDLLKYGRKYNNNTGYLNGELFNERRNYYHKPIANLNWDWDIDDKTSLSTVLYASWGRGGGTGTATTTDKAYPTTSPGRDENGLKKIQEMYDKQLAAGGRSGYGIRQSVNNHQWYGLVSNLNHKFTDELSLNVGFDLRTYKGEHFQQLSNLMGGDYMFETRNKRYPKGYEVSETFSTNPWKALSDFTDNALQKWSYDYSERINYGGMFAQIEYAKDNFSAFFQGAVSNQSNQRWDYFQYDAANEKSEKLNNWGYNVKGGASYTIADNHKVFANAGYYSRQPFHDNLFMNYKNDVNRNAENEKILGLELGYKFKSRNFWANLNAYYTTWENRVTGSSTEVTANNQATYPTAPLGSYVYFVNQGVKQEHKGLELEMSYKPLRTLEFKGFASLGDWKYKGATISNVYDESQNLLKTTKEDLNGLKVGDAAQTQFGLGVAYEFLKGLSVDADYRYNGDLYGSRTTAVNANTKDNGSGNLELPSYNIMDAGITWNYKLTNRNRLTLRFNVNNVFNHIYISEATTNYQADYKGADTYKGINVNNQVYFGYGRTWSASVKITL